MAPLVPRGSAVGFAVLALLTGVVACSEAPQTAGGNGLGTMVISTAADADHLFPPLVTTTLGRVISQQIFEPLASIGDSLNVIGDEGFEPRLADSWNWSPDSLSIAFHLDPRARWHDGVPVRASDVRFTYRLYADPKLAAPSASIFAEIDSVTVRDSLTPVVWFGQRSPQQFYIAATEMDIVPEHVYGKVPAEALASSDMLRRPVGSGRFKFSRWLPGQTIEIVSNKSHYRAPARLDRVVWTIAPDFGAASARFLSGEADFFESVRPEMLAQVQQARGMRVATAPGFKYGFLALNLHDPKRAGAPHPLFGNRTLRRALTMAVDRRAIVRSVFDTLALPSLGPMVRAMPTTDTSINEIPFDPSTAARLLDSLGWKGGDAGGVRHKNGVPLQFTILTPSSSKERGRLAVLLQEQFRRVGVHVDVQTLELNALMQQLGTRNFDAVMTTWALDPDPEAVRGNWGSVAAHAKGSSNFSGYASKQFDAQLDSAASAKSLALARPLFTQAYQTIVDDAPAIWLFEPRSVVGVQQRIRLAPLRADAWWAHLADWSIPGNERVARDLLGKPASSEKQPIRGS
ncbi:MAG: peptide ABC transporter substrate-binding protein [Gemmatimonadaceae bacterium]